MKSTNEEWSNQETIKYIFTSIIKHMYEHAADRDYSETLQEAAIDENPNRLKDMIVELQSGPLLDLLQFLDGSVGPSTLPNIEIVNARDGKALASDYSMAYSLAEGEYLESVDGP